MMFLMWIAGLARAQSQDDSFSFELFRPHADLYGYSTVHGASTLRNLELGVGLWLNYANDPLVLVDSAGNRLAIIGDAGSESSDGVVESRVAGNLQAGVGFTRFVSLTLDLPVVLTQKAWDLDTLNQLSSAPELGAGGGLGDLRLTPKVAILDQSAMSIGLALLIPVGLPTGGASGYLGEKAVTLDPMMAIEWANGSIVNGEHTLRIAGNLGYEVRTADARIRDIHLGNALLYGLGLGIHPASALEIMLEFHGQSYGARSSQNPAEALLGLKLLAGDVTVNVGGGVGILPGIGSPDFRIYTGIAIGHSFDPDARDTDGDLINDGSDQCIKDAEDIDSYQDDDGCPELDNDADGREDAVDKCPNDPEDDDGYLDNDGCPDPDNDKDNVIDTMDKCPDQAEIVNEYIDEDGCPDEKPIDDTDGDGYKDDLDRCPYDAEDKDGYEDEDGCPEKDNDGDSIPDASDKCPNEREIFNNTEDEDGCPDESQRVVVSAGAIEIRDVINFDPGKATVLASSFSLLDEIASVILAHPEIKKIRVEGHTDSDGPDISNLKLSQARTQAVVDYLVSKGVERSRLDPVGFGESRPISDNTTPEGKAKNRRVEFIIVSRD